jgi:hypothetical protein
VAEKGGKRKGPAKSYEERLDPGGELGKQAKSLAALARSPVGRLLRRHGVDQATLDEAKQFEVTYRRLTREPDRISAALAPLGWSLFELAPFDEHAAAATMVEEGRSEEAEDF